MNKLTPEEEDIILYKGTEAPFTGEYDDFYDSESTYGTPIPGHEHYKAFYDLGLKRGDEIRN